MQPLEPVAARISSRDILVTDVLKDPAKISSIVSSVMTKIREGERRDIAILPEEEPTQEEQELDVALDVISKISESPQPIAEMALYTIMHTDFVDRYQKESALTKKRHDFFSYLIKQSEEVVDSKKHIEKLMKVGSLLEKIAGLQVGDFDAANTAMGEVFAQMDFVGEIINVFSLMEASVNRCFQAAIYYSACQKVKQLEEQLLMIPEEDIDARALLGTQIQRLRDFIEIEKKALTKNLPSELLGMAKQGVKIAKWALNLAKEQVQTVKSVTAPNPLVTAAGSVGIVASALGVCSSAISLGKGIKKQVQYQSWMSHLKNQVGEDFPEFSQYVDDNKRIDTFVVDVASTLQNRFHTDMSLEDVEAIQNDIRKNVEEAFSDFIPPVRQTICAHILSRCQKRMIYESAFEHFQNDPIVENPPEDVKKRIDAFQDLRKKVTSFLTKSCENCKIIGLEEFVSLSTHTLLRKLAYRSDRRQTSARQAERSQLMTSQLKSSLTTLAMKKQQIERRRHGFNLGLTTGKLVLAVTGLVVGILLVASCLAPPFSTFVSLGLTLGALLVAGVGAFYLHKTKPDLFKAKWGSIDGWLYPFRQFVSKYRAWRISKLDKQKAQLENKLAPTCYKILLLERLKKKSFPEMKKDCQLLGVPVGKTERATIDAIENQIILLKKTISSKDQLRLEALDRGRERMSQKFKKIEAKVNAMEAQLKTAHQKSFLRRAKRDSGWKQIEGMVEDLKEGVADCLLDGVEFSLPILHELKSRTGIVFDPVALKSLIEKHKVPFAQAREKERSARQSKEEALRVEQQRRTLFDTSRSEVVTSVDPTTKAKNLKKCRRGSKVLALSESRLQQASDLYQQAHEAKLQAYKPLLEALGAPIDAFLGKEEQDLNKLLSR